MNADISALLKIGKNIIVFEVTKKGYIVKINDIDIRKYMSGNKDADLFESKLKKETLGTISIKLLKATWNQIKVYPKGSKK